MAQSRPGEPGGGGRIGGTVAGRYRLDEPRPADLPGAERWSATDQILARPVTVTLVSGPRTTAVLDAARRAALVVDPRLVRILDVGSADGTGYVVTEAVEGRTLAALAARAPLSPDQARAVVGEAAAALEAARRRGVHHLALRPETVLLTPASRVVVDGLAVDGELIGAAGGGAHAMSRADTVGLVRVLYAALTGRWPAPGTGAPAAGTGAVPTFDEWSGTGRTAPATGPALAAGLPDAPQHDDVPLPPADLVTGIPADLDTLCVVTLGPHDDGPHSPGELVRELEPWRAVRADEVFRAADAGRWPALPDQGEAQGAPARGAAGVAGGAGAGGAAAGRGPAGGGTAGGAVGGAAAGADLAAGAGAAAGGGAAGEAGAAGAAAAAGAAVGGIGGGVARQSVRSAFSGAGGPGARRPGTPPPATPAAASFPTAGAADGPGRTSGSSTASRAGEAHDAAETPATGSAPVPPARSAAPAEPAPATATGPDTTAAATAPAPPPPSFPPSIPPASKEQRAASEPTAVEGETVAPAPVAPAAVAPETEAPRQEPVDAGPVPPDVVDDPSPDDPSPADRSPASASAAVVGILSAAPTAPPASAPEADTPDEPAGPGGLDATAGPSPHDTPSPAAPTDTAPTDTAPTDTAPADAEHADAVPAPHPAEEPPVETVRFDPIGSPPGDDGGSGPDSPAWDLPFPAEEPRESFGRRRFDPSRWVLGLVALGVVVGVIIAVGNVLSPFTPGDDGAAAPAPVATTSAPPATEAPADGGGADEPDQAPATDPPVIAAVTSIDPSDGDGEHEELIGRLTDGDPATSWYTHTYNRPDFAGFKEAVGLAVTLQAPATVTSITLDVNGSGGNVEVRSTDAANPTGGDVLASGPLNGQTVLTLSQPTETQSLVLWFTSLAQTPDGANKIEISNISVG